MMNQPKRIKKKVRTQEYQLLKLLRERKPGHHPPVNHPSLGERVADRVAVVMGS